MGDPRHDLGGVGEELAAAWLAARGWRILARRWRCRAGELDIVCLDPGERLVGVEVRLRRSGRAGSPLESLTRRHCARLRAALVEFAVAGGPPHRGLRIDLIAVGPDPGGWRLVRHPAIDAP